MQLLIFTKLSIIAVLAASSPGPDMLVVARSSIAHGKRSGIAVAFGLAMGILIHSTYCILGLALLLANSPAAQKVIQTGGALYLAYLGIKCLHGGGAPISLADGKGRPAQSPTLRADFVCGLTTNLLNPKVTLFVLSIFSQFVDPRTAPHLQALLALNLAGVTLAWFSLLAWAIAWPPLRRSLVRWQVGIDRAFGLVLLVLAAFIFVR